MAVTAAEVPSYKFIPLIYQLVARMGKESNGGGTKSGGGGGFQGALATLLARVCAEHPYHGLYPVFALKNSDRVDASVMEYGLDSDKVAAATQLLSRVKQMAPHRATALKEVNNANDVRGRGIYLHHETMV
eukprot:7091272-Pyramimonas_sp.AAC.1